MNRLDRDLILTLKNQTNKSFFVPEQTSRSHIFAIYDFSLTNFQSVLECLMFMKDKCYNVLQYYTSLEKLS